MLDISAQFSDSRPLALRVRWISLAVGIFFAVILMRFFATGFFTHFLVD
jgi:hypothetical protein